MTQKQQRLKDKELVHIYFEVEEIISNYPSDSQERLQEYRDNEIQGMEKKCKTI